MIKIPIVKYVISRIFQKFDKYPYKKVWKELMVQLLTYTRSDYLLKINSFDNNQLQYWKEKREKMILNLLK